MLADPGRTPGLDLFAAVDPDRAADRQHGVALERHQHFVLDHLLVVGNIIEDADYAEHQAVAVQNPAPFGEILGGKNVIEDPDQFHRARMAIGCGGKPGISDQILPAQAAGQRRPLPLLIEQGQDEPAPVLALVVIGDSVQRALARASFLELGPA